MAEWNDRCDLELAADQQAAARSRRRDRDVPLARPGAKGVSYTFLKGQPISLTQNLVPDEREWFQKAELGIYAQDQWHVQRLTMNLGLRYDYYNGYIPAVHYPATQFVPARDFA